MATYKMTFFLQNSVDNTGWTENWWTLATDAVTALGNVNNYLTVRAATLLDSCSIVALRACNVDTPRDSLYLGTSLPIAGTIARATYPAAGTWDCLLCRRDITLNNLIGHMFMHGVPAAIFTGRAYTPAAVSGLNWVVKFANFVTELTSGPYYLRKKQTGPPPFTYGECVTFLGIRRTEHKLGRPFDALRGRRAVA